MASAAHPEAAARAAAPSGVGTARHRPWQSRQRLFGDTGLARQAAADAWARAATRAHAGGGANRGGTNRGGACAAAALAAAACRVGDCRSRGRRRRGTRRRGLVCIRVDVAAVQEGAEQVPEGTGTQDRAAVSGESVATAHTVRKHLSVRADTTTCTCEMLCVHGTFASYVWRLRMFCTAQNVDRRQGSHNAEAARVSRSILVCKGE